MKIKNLFIPIFILMLIISLVGCQESKEPKKNSDGNELIIYTSVYPYYDIASKIVGDNGTVKNIVPAGVEAHDFEPKSKDIIEISNSDLLIYNGAGFEGWIDKLLEVVPADEMAILEVTSKVELLTTSNTGFMEEEAHEEHNSKTKYDPHVWLDPIRMKEIAKSIKDAISNIDPANQEEYNNNYEKVIKELELLDKEFMSLATESNRDEILVSHAAFGYFTDRYGIKQIPISGLSPSVEPSLKELKEIIEYAKEKNIDYILFESLVNSKVGKMVEEEIGAEALTLSPLESLTEEEIKNSEDYFSVMRKNYESIKLALN